MWSNMGYYKPSITCIFLTITIFLQIRYVASQKALNDKDEDGCGIGEEFQDGSCKLCKPGTYRFFSLNNLYGEDPRLCKSPEDEFNFKLPMSNSKCVPCPPGTYNPFRGAMRFELCRPCPVGTTSGEGARKCRKCAASKSSASGSPRCVKCRPGFFMTKPCISGVAPNTTCTKCPRGSYASEVNSVECIRCPEGTSTAKRGATSKDSCKPCGTEKVRCSCQENGEPWNGVRSYRPIGDPVCTKCPPGSRALTPFATSADECIPCPNGTSYVAYEGCKKCRKGYYSFGAGASYCRKKKEDKCPFDSFKDAEGVCKLCPSGYKLDGLKCTRCAPGTVSQGYREKTCRECKFPKAAPPNGGDGSCECARNHYRYLGDTFECLPCPKGTSIDREFHSESRCDVDCKANPNSPQCEPCKADYGRDYETKKCQKCEKGLRSLVGEEECMDPRTGCPKDFEKLPAGSNTENVIRKDAYTHKSKPSHVTAPSGYGMK